MIIPARDHRGLYFNKIFVGQSLAMKRKSSWVTFT